MNHDQLHRQILSHSDRALAWYNERSRGLSFPIYSSFDIRDAGFKIGPVDANIFPAGFNNVCLVDRENAVGLAQRFLDHHYPGRSGRILILTEEHTQNLYYWDNVNSLKVMFEGAGREVRLGIPRDLSSPLQILSASGVSLTVSSAQRSGDGIDIDGFKPDLIISNNDFSTEYEEWARGLKTPMNPPRELGWYRRRKDRFFKIYNQLAKEFSECIELDPWILQVETEVFSDFEVDEESSREKLAIQAEQVLARIKAKYREHGVAREPFLFVKNNAGTYGLGVVQVSDAREIAQWNNKTRKKMKAAKGGREVSEVIIQEGIPTTLQGEGGFTAEPVIYMIGCQLAGGFLRTHAEKGDQESLNSPGAVFQRLCISDLEVKLAGCPMENSYGWIARLSFLSVAIEARELGVEFPAYSLGL